MLTWFSIRVQNDGVTHNGPIKDHFSSNFLAADFDVLFFPHNIWLIGINWPK